MLSSGWGMVPADSGVILVGRAQAPVWDVSVNHHIEPRKP